MYNHLVWLNFSRSYLYLFVFLSSRIICFVWVNSNVFAIERLFVSEMKCLCYTLADVDTVLVSVAFETVLYSSGYVSSNDSNSLRNSIILSYLQRIYFSLHINHTNMQIVSQTMSHTHVSLCFITLVMWNWNNNKNNNKTLRSNLNFAKRLWRTKNRSSRRFFCYYRLLSKSEATTYWLTGQHKLTSLMSSLAESYEPCNMLLFCICERVCVVYVCNLVNLMCRSSGDKKK